MLFPTTLCGVVRFLSLLSSSAPLRPSSSFFLLLYKALLLLVCTAAASEPQPSLVIYSYSFRKAPLLYPPAASHSEPSTVLYFYSFLSKALLLYTASYLPAMQSLYRSSTSIDSFVKLSCLYRRLPPSRSRSLFACMHF